MEIDLNKLTKRNLADYIVTMQSFDNYIVRVMSHRFDQRLDMLEVHIKFGIGAKQHHARVTTIYLTKTQMLECLELEQKSSRA